MFTRFSGSGARPEFLPLCGGHPYSMPADWIGRFDEESEFQEVGGHLEGVERRQRLRRALEVAQTSLWLQVVRVVEVEDPAFADFLRLHPELSDLG